MNQILVIDDEPICRANISHLLTREGHEVTFATNGREGLNCLDNACQTFDLILLDWVMPEVNGVQFMHRFKQTNHFKKIPVIMLTCVNDGDAVVEAIQTGIYDYLVKPVTSDALVELVDRAVTCTSET